MYPRCLTNLAKTYLSANGYVLPCCWLGNRPDIYELEKFLKEDFKYCLCNNSANNIVVPPDPNS